MFNDKKDFLKRAMDSDAFAVTDSSASVVNPKIWDKNVLNYAEANLIVAGLGENYDFRGPGSDLQVTIDAAPTAAADLTESVDVAIDAISYSSVTFTPEERGAAYQLTDKEARRAFFSVMQNMTKKLGYRYALKMDTLAVSTVQAGAGTAINANDATAGSLDSSDTLNLGDINKAVRIMETNNYFPDKMVINAYQKQNLMDLIQFTDASKFGTRDAIQKGLIGEIAGLNIFQTTQIAVASNEAKALILGENASGEKSFGLAIKADPSIKTEYHARGRYTDVVAVGEYDIKVLHPEGIVTLNTYCA